MVSHGMIWGLSELAPSRPGSHWNPRIAGVASEAMFIGQGWVPCFRKAWCHTDAQEKDIRSFNANPNLLVLGCMKVQFHWNRAFKVACLQMVVDLSCSCLQFSACEVISVNSSWTLPSSVVVFPDPSVEQNQQTAMPCRPTPYMFS